MADVVERLQRQPRQERRVAHDDGDPLHGVAEIAGRRQALGDREAGSGVAAVHHIVGGLAPPREAADAVDLAQRVEPLEAPGQQLVGIGLVAGVPHDPVARRFQQPVQREGDLDHTERGAEVAAGRRDRADDRLAELAGELHELRLGQAAQVGGLMQAVEDRHG